MSSQDLISYIERPSQLNENTIFDLTLVSEKYPYFQTAQLLRIKNLHNLSPDGIKPAINYTAAYVTDRKILYYLLHPIKTENELTPEKRVEKEVKDTIGENIADTLESQKHYLENNDEEAIEFSTAINVKKEYGQDVKLDEYVVRITENGPELYELIENNEKGSDQSEPVPTDKANDASRQSEEDILTLINKGVPVEHFGGENNNFSATQQRSNSIIDQFIKTNPKIKPENKTGQHNDFSEESVKENDHLITDTLANIYVKQGNYAKAIFAYEKLSLKYPEKSAYFAGQIEEIKKLIEKSK